MKHLLILLIFSLTASAVDFPDKDMRAYKYYRDMGKSLIEKLKANVVSIEKLEEEIEKLEQLEDQVYDKIRNTESQRTKDALYKKKNHYRSKSRTLELLLEKLNKEESKMKEKVKEVKKKYDFHKAKVRKYYDEVKREKEQG